MVSQDSVLDAAQTMFLRDGWLDLRALAAETGIGRATLYRHYEGREHLLGEVLWRLMEPTMQQVSREVRAEGHSGADAVAENIRRCLTISASLPQMRAMMDRDAETTMRVMASKHGVVQRRLIASVAGMISQEIGDTGAIPLETLAYAVVRVGESFYYRELITGDAPDIDAAALIIRKLLA
ncbi:TetR/AcrR family transcriptional regulator [Pseudonocardiaceae bacterium YIM PH 21723]|nr:TetR/AcrR family transcriptional regulator [Pseudonocardiaceae bacterium YIM PH 21723]